MHEEYDVDKVWRVKLDVKLDHKFGILLLKDGYLGVKNGEEISSSLRKWMKHLGDSGELRYKYKTTPLPSGFPNVIVNFPSIGFAPDYFSFGSYDFCSTRLRDALAQPSEVIDYTPIDFRCQDEKALAQDYQRMRIIAVQPAMDMQRSLYKAEDATNPVPGETTRRIRNIDKIVLREDFTPKSEIFCMAERTVDVLATDALAERVLKADCTGLEFRHLETPDWTGGTQVTVRTKRGTRQRGG